MALAIAMFTVAGIAIGYYLADWGYTLAYVCLWIAFVHFVVRGVQKVREGRASH